MKNSIKLEALGDICEFLDHLRRPVSEELRKPGPYPYYGANGQQGWIDGYIFNEPLVLLAEDGGHFGSKTNPIAFKISGRTWVNNHAHVLRPLPGCDLDYLTYALSLLDVTKLINGTTRPKLTKGSAESIHIPFPELPEQKRIAAILERADRLRRLRRYALELEADVLAAAFEGKFGDSRTNPLGWDQCPIGDILQFSQYGTSQKSNSEKRGVPVIGMGNVTNTGEIDLSSLAYVDLQPHEFQELKLESGDIVFNRTNSTELVGKTACWRLDMDAVVASYLVRLRLKPTVVPEFFAALLNSSYFKALFRERCKRAVGQSNISPTLLKEFVMYCPPVRIQEEFASVVRKREALRAIQRESLRQAEHLFQTLLHRAFRSGL